jgi:hypothetical protein
VSLRFFANSPGRPYDDKTTGQSWQQIAGEMTDEPDIERHIQVAKELNQAVGKERWD